MGTEIDSARLRTCTRRPKNFTEISRELADTPPETVRESDTGAKDRDLFNFIYVDHTSDQEASQISQVF